MFADRTVLSGAYEVRRWSGVPGCLVRYTKHTVLVCQGRKLILALETFLKPGFKPHF
jgi:hypothetical protein